MDYFDESDAGAQPEPALTLTMLADNSDRAMLALRLGVLVGMAHADGAIADDEISELRTILASWDTDDETIASLSDLLDVLVKHPPALDELLRDLVAVGGALDAQLFVQDLTQMAHADGKVDAREEGMLRMVCGAFEIDPVTLYDGPDRAHADVSAEDLSMLVRSLISA